MGNRLSGAFGSREGSRQTTPSGSRLTTPSGGSTRNSGASGGLSARNLLGKAAAAGDSVPLPPLPTIQASFARDHRSETARTKRPCVRRQADVLWTVLRLMFRLVAKSDCVFWSRLVIHVVAVHIYAW